MPKILSPKEVSGTTRFMLDFKLTSTMFVQLFKEFRSDYTEFQSTSNSFKFINKAEKTALEIGDDYISIFPELNDIDTESFRKRIYKHIAKRSEVYIGTSRENLNLSITSLLTDDLRSCASLLYYSLHKYINGEMYNFFNNDIGLEEHEIDFKEIEHFTSANFYNFTKKNKTKKITKDNYHEVLCLNKPKCIDPFKLSMEIIQEDIINNCKESFRCYIDFLSLNLFEVAYENTNISNVLEQELHEFQKRRSSKKSTQEEEVRAAIAYALLESKKEIQEGTWMFFVLSLRLYWLRQTADYEFDFEVKTSVREMSILVSSIKHFLEIQKELEGIKETEEISKNEGLDNESFAINRKKEEKEEILEVDSSGLIYFNVDANFPSDIVYSEEVHTFLTALHLDSFFNKDNVINALNLTDYVTNKGKYFVYENRGPLKISLYLHINDEGRWTAWIPNNNYQVNILSPSELIEIFDNFWKSFVQSYKGFFDENFEFVLAASKPLFPHETQVINSESLSIIEKGTQERKQNYIIFLARKIGSFFKKATNFNTIEMDDLTLNIDVSFKYDYNSLVPFSQIFFRKVFDEKNKLVYINFLISEKSEFIDDITTNARRIVPDLIKKHNFENTIEQNFIVNLSPDEADGFLDGSNQEPLLTALAECLNDIAYHRIMNNFIEGANQLIELSLELPTPFSLSLATKGMWYLRNEKLDIEECEAQGKKYYEEAIKAEQEDLINLKQKYYYEQARFYLLRKEDYQAAEENVDQAMLIGENGIFFEEVLKLLNLFPDKKDLEESATTVEDALIEE
ncbi:hypothetical protein FZC83_15530 [Rossellomorea marisflavi]|uniref:Uncharacterized protein n=1 Tax=Rossellomorea marisflavi TaxID=189381 RepID=A0A5D4RQ46_9BACI|nr:hypothetical protein [Rossellomorea marisflavi]TYS53100.1 hypothetical protein FZC83_15530 [Rossellomorea marisflavi]